MHLANSMLRLYGLRGDEENFFVPFAPLSSLLISCMLHFAICALTVLQQFGEVKIFSEGFYGISYVHLVSKYFIVNIKCCTSNQKLCANSFFFPLKVD